MLNKREDGFHNIESIFFPVPWKDALEVIESGEVKFIREGKKVDGEVADNICLKAYHLLKQQFDLPPVNMCLYKNIPVGAGLGGGSADGAFTLKLLNEKFNLGQSDDVLSGLAANLGSDCPFFIKNKPAYITGRGEVMEDIAVALNGYSIVIAHPGVTVNTGWAYKELAASRVTNKWSPENLPSLKQVIKEPVVKWEELLENDFEKIVFPFYPVIEQLKNELYKRGALYAGMSGSGSAVFGIFEDKMDVNAIFSAKHIYDFQQFKVL